VALEGVIGRVRLFLAQGEDAAAEAELAEAERIAQAFDASEFDDEMVSLTRMHQALQVGSIERARQWADARGLVADATQMLEELEDNVLRKYQYLALAELLVHEGRSEQALPMLEALTPYFDRHEVVIRLQLQRAVAADAMGDGARARAALEQALALGEPAGYVRVFLDQGPPVARLLHEAARRGVRPGYVGKLLAQFPVAEEASLKSDYAGAHAGLVEPLSERELEILALIGKGKTNQEIADRLYLSLSTVKWHTSNIYGKLGVANRTEAVGKGQSLGLLEPPLV
jgi:LuxR family maltose regulon positive regulatory protein